jgi:hypothetical protein
MNEQPTLEANAEIVALRRNLTWLALAMLVLSSSVNLFVLRQVISVRKDLMANRSTIVENVESFQKGEGEVKSFVAKLQAYSKTHPTFAPVLAKYMPALTQYGLTPSATEPAGDLPPTIPPTTK